MIVNRARYASLPCPIRRASRVRCRYRKTLSILRALAPATSTSYRTANKAVPFQWVQENDALPFPTDTEIALATENTILPNSEDWQRLQDLTKSALRLLRASLKGNWPRVEAAVYCRLMNPGEEKNSLQFMLVNNMDLLAEDPQSYLRLDDADCSLSEMDTSRFLIENEVVEISSRNCVLLPLVKNSCILGLFLLSLPVKSSPDEMTSVNVLFQDDVETVNDAKNLLLNALDQYQSSAKVKLTAQQQREFTKATLKESKGAVKSVRSLTKLLSCQPTTGSLEKDMISGIERQGEKMSLMVRRLETAFNISPEPFALSSSFNATESLTLVQSGLDN